MPEAMFHGVPVSSESSPLANQLHGLRILVVDDNVDSREILRGFCEYYGAEVIESDSGRAAFRFFKRNNPDVIVTDIAMPQWSGYHLLRKIRGLPDRLGGRTPIVAITAYKQLHERPRARVAGFDAWLTKPLDIPALINTIRRVGRRVAGSRAG
jgi:CheY-like chemotaxis protein